MFSQFCYNEHSCNKLISVKKTARCFGTQCNSTVFVCFVWTPGFCFKSIIAWLYVKSSHRESHSNHESLSTIIQLLLLFTVLAAQNMITQVNNV